VIVEFVKAQLYATSLWKTFEEKRRHKTKKALVDLLLAHEEGHAQAHADAGDEPMNAFNPIALGERRKKLLEEHVDQVLEAAFPLSDLVPLIGADALVALADALRKRDDS
jgi:hypothetical protein